MSYMMLSYIVLKQVLCVTSSVNMTSAQSLLAADECSLVLQRHRGSCLSNVSPADYSSAAGKDDGRHGMTW